MSDAINSRVQLIEHAELSPGFGHDACFSCPGITAAGLRSKAVLCLLLLLRISVTKLKGTTGTIQSISPGQNKLHHSSQIMFWLRSASTTGFENRGSCFIQSINHMPACRLPETLGKYLGRGRKCQGGDPSHHYLSVKGRVCFHPLPTPFDSTI